MLVAAVVVVEVQEQEKVEEVEVVVVVVVHFDTKWNSLKHSFKSISNEHLKSISGQYRTF